MIYISQIQDHVDSAVRLFEPYELKPLTFKELRDAVLIPAKKEGIIFDEEIIEIILRFQREFPITCRL
jgi:hypothetical protein